MLVDLHMKDGRTVFRFMTRGRAVVAMTRKPLDMATEGGLSCWVQWHQGTEGWIPYSVVYINPSSVSYVVAVSNEDRDAFLAEYRPAREKANA